MRSLESIRHRPKEKRVREKLGVTNRHNCGIGLDVLLLGQWCTGKKKRILINSIGIIFKDQFMSGAASRSGCAVH